MSPPIFGTTKTSAFYKMARLRFFLIAAKILSRFEEKMNYRKSVISGKKLAEVLVHLVREFHHMPSTKEKTGVIFRDSTYTSYSMLSSGGSETQPPLYDPPGSSKSYDAALSTHQSLWPECRNAHRWWCCVRAQRFTTASS